MPWKIKSKGSQFCVVKESDGSEVACHPTKEKAEAQLRALYANVKDVLGALPPWLQVKGDMNGDGDGAVEMTLNDSIGYDPSTGKGVSSEYFGRVMGALKDRPVTLNINSLGGRHDDGIAMHNMVRSHGNVTTRVIGYAASMGAIIHQAGKVRQMMPGTMFVIHNPTTNPGMTDEHGLDNAKETLKKVKNSLVDILSSRSGQGKRAVSDMMDKTTAMDAKEAKDMGFCDEITEGSPAWNDISHDAVNNFLKQVRNNTTDLGERHPPTQQRDNNKGHTMSKLTETLARLGLITSADMTEEAAAAAVETIHGRNTQELTVLRTEHDTAVAALKNRVTNKVQKAIDDKLISPDAKDSIIELGVKNESALKFIDDLRERMATPAAPARRGAPPVPVDAPQTEGAEILDRMRTDAVSGSKAKGNADDILVIARNNAANAKKMRELRGHKDLFAVPAK